MSRERIIVWRSQVRAVSIAVAILLSSAPGGGLQSVGLSGNWVGDSERNAGAIERGALSPADNLPITITEDEHTFTVTKRGPEGKVTTAVYRFDGTETKVEGPRWFTLSTAARDGRTVIITGTRSTGGQVRTVYSLVGDDLVIESTSRSRSGQELMTSVYYKRAPKSDLDERVH